MGELGKGFSMLAAIVLVALVIQLYFLRPSVKEYADTN